MTVRYLLTSIASLSLMTAALAAQPTQPAGNSYELTGTMVHTNLEGGCWYLDASNGQHYELVGDSALLDELRVENRKVDIIVRDTKGLASTCMVGQIVEVVQNVNHPQGLHPTDLAIMPMQLDGTMHKSRSGVWYVKTKLGARYEFKGLPPKKYRRIGASIHAKYRVILDKNSTQTGADGVIVGPNQKIEHGTVVDAPSKNIEKKYPTK